MRFPTRWKRLQQATGWPFGLYMTAGTLALLGLAAWWLV